ncbi:MAG: hypothetical protein MHM6MM_009055, partial [Cercozoa sp. M6MM]
MSQLLPVLQHAHMGDRQALKQLQDAEHSDFRLFLQELCGIFMGAVPADDTLRAVAGMTVKNALSAKSKMRQQQLTVRWISQPDEVRHGVRHCALEQLKANNESVRNAAAQLVSAVAKIELAPPKSPQQQQPPQSMWPELVPTLLGYIGASETPMTLREASFVTLGCDTACVTA